MSALLILRQKDDTEQYYLSGTGWVGTRDAATAYPTIGAAMPDAQALRDAPGSLPFLVVKDMSTGTEYRAPWMHSGSQ